MKKAEDTKKVIVNEANLEDVSGGIIEDVAWPKTAKPVTPKPTDETADPVRSVMKDTPSESFPRP